MDSLALADFSLLQKTKPISRDEMNLAEFPLTVLSTRSSSSIKTLEFRDSVKGRNGELIQRTWTITAADKFGLPTSSDDEVLLGLIKLTVDDGFKSKKVFFTRYELLRTLQWTTEGRSYVRLQKALDRLSGVRIKATNAFFDNESKSHSTRNFGIVDAYEINDGRSTEPKPSFFTWSEVIFRSFQVGFIKKLDLSFYLSLKSSVSKRLYRFLDKHFWYRSRIEINLFVLAHEKIGISRNYQFASSLRQQMDPAFEELMAKGFLSKFEYRGRGKDTVVALYAAVNKLRVKALALGSAAAAQNNFEETYSRVRELLISHGIRPVQVDKLLHNRTLETLRRMQDIVQYFDELRSAQSHLISRNPIGFLYRAIENPDNFMLPGDGKSRPLQGAFGFSVEAQRKDSKTTRTAGQGAGAVDNGGNARITGDRLKELEAEYLVQRKQELQKMAENAEPEVVKRITQEVEAALIKLKSLISPVRFSEAVRHGVEERLVKLFAFPDFEEWVRKRTSRVRSKTFVM